MPQGKECCALMNSNLRLDYAEIFPDVDLIMLLPVNPWGRLGGDDSDGDAGVMAKWRRWQRGSIVNGFQHNLAERLRGTLGEVCPHHGSIGQNYRHGTTGSSW